MNNNIWILQDEKMHYLKCKTTFKCPWNWIISYSGYQIQFCYFGDSGSAMAKCLCCDLASCSVFFFFLPCHCQNNVEEKVELNLAAIHPNQVSQSQDSITIIHPMWVVMLYFSVCWYSWYSCWYSSLFYQGLPDPSCKNKN